MSRMIARLSWRVYANNRYQSLTHIKTHIAECNKNDMVVFLFNTREPSSSVNMSRELSLVPLPLRHCVKRTVHLSHLHLSHLHLSHLKRTVHLSHRDYNIIGRLDFRQYFRIALLAQFFQIINK